MAAQAAPIHVNPPALTTHQRHIQFIQNLEHGFVVRRPDGTELAVTIPLNNMLVRFGINLNQIPTIVGNYRVVAINNPNFVRELDALALRVSVSLFPFSLTIY